MEIKPFGIEKKVRLICHGSMVADEAVNLTSEKHDPYAQISHLHKRRKQKYLTEGTGVEPAKYPPKVKLEIFSQL